MGLTACGWKWGNFIKFTEEYLGSDYIFILFDVNAAIAEAIQIFLDSFLLRAQRFFSIVLHTTYMSLSLQHTWIITIIYIYFPFYLKYLIIKLFLQVM